MAEKKLLITGANGFVGQQVVRSLGVTESKLYVVLRKGALIDPLLSKRVEKIIYTDNLFAESVEWWADQCSGIDTIIHLAWYTKPGKYLNSNENIDCLLGSYHLAHGAKIAGVSRFVGVGTCAEYDLTYGTLSVDTPLKPETLYGSTKVALYHVLRDWYRGSSIEFAWCRLFYLYGEGEHPDRLVPYVKRQLLAGERVDLSNGTQIRDFIDVKIAGQMICSIAIGERVGAFNICSGVPKTVREMVLDIADEYSRPDLLNFGARDDNLTDLPIILGVPNFI
ncbi:MAG: NAD(P)-dependent oxidoreductase [Paracoccaceae bacterium]